jgi:hypothetical protein
MDLRGQKMLPLLILNTRLLDRQGFPGNMSQPARPMTHTFCPTDHSHFYHNTQIRSLEVIRERKLHKLCEHTFRQFVTKIIYFIVLLSCYIVQSSADTQVSDVPFCS